MSAISGSIVRCRNGYTVKLYAPGEGLIMRCWTARRDLAGAILRASVLRLGAVQSARALMARVGLLALLLLAGCGGIAVEQDPTTQPIQEAPDAGAVAAPDAAPDATVCKPLEIRQCPAGSPGQGPMQRCYDDGSGWGPCV
jgi:hypothetical protein